MVDHWTASEGTTDAPDLPPVNARRIRSCCRFCGERFLGAYRDFRPIALFCPRCRALHRAAIEAVRRFEESVTIARPEDMPHCTLIRGGVRRRGEAA